MLAGKSPIPQKYWLYCAHCVDLLGYKEDAPRFATERGLKRHLKLVHGVVENKLPRFSLACVTE